MDPVSVQTARAVLLRPTGAGEELARVLQRGQVVAGEVLAAHDAGAVLLAIGRHRVPAQSEVRLEPGQRFVFEVVETADGVALRILEGASEGDEPALLRALRAVIGGSQPIGEILNDLRAAVALAEPAPRPDSPLAALARALARHVWSVDDGAEALARLLERSGASYEAHLLDAALAGGSPRDLERAVRALAAELFADLAGGDAGEPDGGALGRTPEAFLGKLAEALARVLGAGSEAARTPGALDEHALARDLGPWIRRALAALGRGPEVERAAARLATLDFDSWTREERLLLARSLLGAPLAPAGERDPGRVRARLARLVADLKADLLRARAALPAGETRAAVERALAALESEQLLNLARAEGGEPRHWSLPIADGARLATLDLTHRRVEERAGSPDGEPAHRLSFAVDFTYTGPVRADLLARRGSLAVRLSVVRPDVRARLEADLEDLRARLATGGRAVQLALVPAELAEVRVRPDPAEIRYLREHHVMDLRG